MRKALKSTALRQGSRETSRCRTAAHKGTTASPVSAAWSGVRPPRYGIDVFGQICSIRVTPCWRLSRSMVIGSVPAGISQSHDRLSEWRSIFSTTPVFGWAGGIASPASWSDGRSARRVGRRHRYQGRLRRGRRAPGQGRAANLQPADRGGTSRLDDRARRRSGSPANSGRRGRSVGVPPH